MDVMNLGLTRAEISQNIRGAIDSEYQYIHPVTNELVTETVETDCDVIVFGDLTDIRETISHVK